MFTGSFTALVTPFRNGVVDADAFAALIDWQIESGTHGLVPCGTTGEAAALSAEEHAAVVRACAAQAAGRVPVVAGAGAPSTAATIEKVAVAADLGADAALVVTPYYVRPDQAGLIAHFTAVADAATIPLILYNVPKRTGVDMADATIAALSRHPRIAGVKEASADLGRVARLRATCADGFVLLSGDDFTALGFNAHGGDGCISVVSNVAPAAFSRLQAASVTGRFDAARAENDRLAPLYDAMFASPSPGPAKYALAQAGRIAMELRSPLQAPDADARARIDAAAAALAADAEAAA